MNSDVEIVGPQPIEDDARLDALDYRKPMGSAFDAMSIARYMAVFGVVPDVAPYRQWLNLRRDRYIHIADLWNDPELRARTLARLQRDRRSYKLCRYLSRDLEYLDEFAALSRRSAAL